MKNNHQFVKKNNKLASLYSIYTIVLAYFLKPSAIYIF